MAFKAGYNCSLLLDGNDISQYFTNAALTVAVKTADTSTFGSNWAAAIEGTAAAKVNSKGLYDLNIDAWLAATLRDGGSVLTYGPAGLLAIGDLARLVKVHSATLIETSPVGGAVLMEWDVTADGIVGFGYCLHPAGADTNTTTGATRDDGASTSTGWHAHLHVLAVSGGSWVVKLTDASASNFSDGADVAGGAFTAATGATARRLAGAATTTALRRYVRYVATRTGGIVGDTITFGLAISRN